MRVARENREKNEATKRALDDAMRAKQAQLKEQIEEERAATEAYMKVRRGSRVCAA